MVFMIAVVAFILALIQALLGRLIGEEITARWPRLIDSVVQFAVGQLPEFYRGEMEREWRSVVADLPGPISKLFQTLDFVRGAISISLQERQIANRRDEMIANGSLQVLTGAAGMWLLQRAESLPSVKDTRTFRWAQVGLLTFMVVGYGKHAEAHFRAAERFAELGNDQQEAENRAEAEKIGEKVLDRMVEVGLVYAFNRMADETPEDASAN